MFCCCILRLEYFYSDCAQRCSVQVVTAEDFAHNTSLRCIFHALVQLQQYISGLGLYRSPFFSTQTATIDITYSTARQVDSSVRIGHDRFFFCSRVYLNGICVGQSTTAIDIMGHGAAGDVDINGTCYIGSISTAIDILAHRSTRKGNGGVSGYYC